MDIKNEVERANTEMGKIKFLDEATSSKIAAGEIVEKPASVVKELVENSLDAGASQIDIQLTNGGISMIRVTDNGCGIDEEDVPIAFGRHATSKISTLEDIDSLRTLGFRGEALASIAAVSQIELISRVSSSLHGSRMIVEGGELLKNEQTGSKPGTSITVSNLFYNTPVRYKFLKKNNVESGYILDIITRLALANPAVSFYLESDGRDILRTPGDGSLKSCIYSLYGKKIAENSRFVEYETENAKAYGFFGNENISWPGRNHQTAFVNSRYIKNKTISAALDEAYRTHLMRDRHCFAVVNIIIPPSLYDVNVHPGKMEVKFAYEKEIFHLVYHIAKNALSATIRRDIADDRIIDFPEPNSPEEFAYESATYKSKPPRESNPYIPVSPEKVLSSVIHEESENYQTSFMFEKTSPLENILYVGQIFNSYLIFQKSNEMIIIDQHAAHERIKFEEIKQAWEQGEDFSQFLLTPLVIETNSIDNALLSGKEGFFRKLGFVYENFGNNALLIRAVPYELNEADACEIISKVVSLVENDCALEPGCLSLAVRETLYQISCKRALKANTKIDQQAALYLIRILEKMENPFTCVHGRPLAFTYYKGDLEKLFRRK